MARTAEEIVRQEVFTCLSSLVYELAQQPQLSPDMNEAVMGLYSGPIDYEEAAIQDGWSQTHDGGLWHHTDEHDEPYDGTARDLCDFFDIDTSDYQREVFEHWAVSSWLADRLEEKGETVDKDFYGLCVWARTTTGQSIAIDGVIEEIVADLNAKYGD